MDGLTQEQTRRVLRSMFKKCKELEKENELLLEHNSFLQLEIENLKQKKKKKSENTSPVYSD